MGNQMKQLFCSGLAVLANCIPLPAWAEMHGAANYLNPSWASLASAECLLSGWDIASRRPYSEPDNSTQLVVDLVPIPEPETYLLMLVGLAAVIAVARRKRPN